MTASQSDAVQKRGSAQWLQSTGAVVLMLLGVQFLSGALLAFYYVPSVDHAHTTVWFVEKALSSGSWIRSLHHYGSQWLPFFLFLHLVRLRVCQAYKSHRTQWVVSVALLALVMAAGATGYSLPWDARAFFSTRVAEGLLAGLPFVGRIARLWLLGGSEISTLTLSRFFALHILVIPFLMLIVVASRLAVCRSLHPRVIGQHAVSAAIVFTVLAIWALKFHAPIGPSVADINADYLPRPGAQFLWLYESLKHLPGAFGSFVGLVVPGLVLLVLVSLPWLEFGFLRRLSREPQGLMATMILAAIALWVATLTTVSYVSDRRDPRTRQQLLKQESEEQAFRATPFQPTALISGPQASDIDGAPKAYLTFCANCHGTRGEGGRQGTLRFPPLAGVAAKPRRSIEDIVGLLNDPTAYGLEPPMRSFATKLTEQEKRDIAQWVAALR